VQVFVSRIGGRKTDDLRDPEDPLAVEDLPQKEAKGIPFEEDVKLFFRFLGKVGWEEKVIYRVFPVKVQSPSP